MWTARGARPRPSRLPDRSASQSVSAVPPSAVQHVHASRGHGCCQSAYSTLGSPSSRSSRSQLALGTFAALVCTGPAHMCAARAVTRWMQAATLKGLGARGAGR